jgi:hypothetical protein
MGNPQKAKAWYLSPALPKQKERKPYRKEHGSLALFWADLIIDVQGKLGYLSTDTRTPHASPLPGIRVGGGGKTAMKSHII